MIHYIVTCHNSGSHIAYVMEALFKVRSQGNPVYCVLDGCTDNTEVVVKRWPVKIIKTPDVYEMRCLNIAFSQIGHADGDLFFILQDDVVLEDQDTETKVKWLYQVFDNLGIVGMRHGVNIALDALTSNSELPFSDHVENDHNIPDFQLPGYRQLPNGCVTFRQSIYKSPIIIPCALYNAIGGYDERYWPTAHDDTEFALRALKAGFRNMVAAIQVCQPMQWRGGAKDTAFDFGQLHIDHMNLIREQMPDTLDWAAHNHPPAQEIRLWPPTC